MTTVRMVWPQWQGGMNPQYVFGSELLGHIVPETPGATCVQVPVARTFDGPKMAEHGIDRYCELFNQAQEARQLLEQHAPDRVVVLGGDCSVTQVPFDYLHGRYHTGFGVLWLDAHPDIARTGETSHLHEMPLANLLGLNPETPLTAVQHPVASDDVFMGGLIEERLRPMDGACTALGLRIGGPETLQQGPEQVLDWMQDRGITHLAVHWDLDVLDPGDFRSIYPGEPHTDPAAFPAAVGRMALHDVVNLLCALRNETDIVGLSITEHLPWDALAMRRELARLMG